MSSTAGVAKSEQHSSGFGFVASAGTMGLILFSDQQCSTTSLERQLVFPGCQKKARAKLFARIQDQFANAHKVMAGTVLERRDPHHCSVFCHGLGTLVSWDHGQWTPGPKGTCLSWTSAPLECHLSPL